MKKITGSLPFKLLLWGYPRHHRRSGRWGRPDEHRCDFQVYPESGYRLLRSAHHHRLYRTVNHPTRK